MNTGRERYDPLTLWMRLRVAQAKTPNLLLANAMLFYTTVTLANDLRALIKEGYQVDAAAVAALSPYATNGLECFGTYTLNLESVPEPLDYDTPVTSA